MKAILKIIFSMNVNPALFGFGSEPLLFKTQQNTCVEIIQNGGKSVCLMLEQKSAIKLLLLEKCKPCENCRIQIGKTLFYHHKPKLER